MGGGACTGGGGMLIGGGCVTSALTGGAPVTGAGEIRTGGLGVATEPPSCVGGVTEGDVIPQRFPNPPNPPKLPNAAGSFAIGATIGAGGVGGVTGPPNPPELKRSRARARPPNTSTGSDLPKLSPIETSLTICLAHSFWAGFIGGAIGSRVIVGVAKLAGAIVAIL